jgi:exopolysaccharide production protein ExoQ
VFVVSLVTLWNIRTLLINKDAPHRRRHLVAQGVLLAFGIALFGMADCATCIVCFILGGGLILVTNLRFFRTRITRVYALCLAIVLGGAGTLLFGGEGGVVHALGRKSNLSGRTEIWAAVVSAVPNAIFGAGFESFWIGPDVTKVWRGLVGWWHPEGINEAHNGYIEVYANLGWIGVCLVAFILITGYKRAIDAFRQNPPIGALMLAFVIAATVYGITEAGFRLLNLMWIFLLLAIITASGVAGGFFGRESSTALPSGNDISSESPAAKYRRRKTELIFSNHRT